MAEKEYTELQLKAKAEGVKSWHVKSDDQLSKELATKLGQDAQSLGTADKEAADKEAAGPVTFFWKNGRNVEFSIETKASTPTSLRQAESFASQDSVLVLDESLPVEARAIAKLRNSPKFKVDFDEVNHRRVSPDTKGVKLDELMELDHKVLVQMVGGSIQDHRKTKGELINQIMS